MGQTPTLRERLRMVMQADPKYGLAELKQSDLAGVAKVKPAAVTAWFKREPPIRKLSSPVLMRISKARKVRSEWLADGTLPMRESRDPAVPASIHNVFGIEPEDIEFARDWAQLEEPAKSTVREVLRLAVQAQKLAARHTGKRKSEPAQPRPESDRPQADAL